MRIKAMAAVLALLFAAGGAPAVSNGLCAKEACDCTVSCSGTCPFDGQGGWSSASGSNCMWSCYYSDGHYYLASCL
jgi:hypothetical protein